MTLKQITLFVTVVLSILLSIIVAWQLLGILVLFMASLMISATVRAPIDFFIRRGLPHTLALALTYLLGAGFVVGLGYLLSTAFVDEINLLVADTANIYTRLQAGWLGNERISPLLSDRLPTPEQIADLIATDFIDDLTLGTILVSNRIVSVGGQIFLAIVLSIYWSADRVRFERLWLSFFPLTQRGQARKVWRALEDGVGAYARSQLVQSVVAGGILTAIYILLGLHYPFLWAIVVALAWLIPLVGIFFALIPMAMVVWVNVGMLITISAIIATIGVLLFMEFVIGKRLYQHSRYQKVLVLIIMLAVVDLYGLMGLLIAPFIATALQIFTSEIVSSWTKQTSQNPSISASLPAEIVPLHHQLAEVSELLDNGQDPTSMRLRNIAKRMDKIFEEAERLQNDGGTVATSSL